MNEGKNQLIICLFCILLVFLMVIVILPTNNNDNVLLSPLSINSAVVVDVGVDLQDKSGHMYINTDNGISNKDLILLIPCAILLLSFSFIFVIKTITSK